MRHSTFLIKLRFTMSSESVEASVGNKRCNSSCLLSAMSCASAYFLTCLRQGTEFLMQVPVRMSTLSTMTNGFSSRVTIERWFSSASSSPYELYLGHTGNINANVPFSQRPICVCPKHKQNQGPLSNSFYFSFVKPPRYNFFFYLLPLPFTIQYDDNQFGVGLVTIWSEGQVPPFVPYMHHVSESHRQERE